jgi:hypothetical protein
LKGEEYQFKVKARQEGSVPSEPATPTAEAEQTTEPNVNDDSGSDFTVRLGVGVAYNTRETIQVQFYDGYHFSLWLEPGSFGLKLNYRNTVGTFRQTTTLDADLLYNTGFLYGGAGAGIFNFGDEDGGETEVNLNAVAGIGFSIGGIYPYVEYRFPFSRGSRDEVVSGGILYSF